MVLNRSGWLLVSVKLMGCMAMNVATDFVVCIRLKQKQRAFLCPLLGKRAAVISQDYLMQTWSTWAASAPSATAELFSLHPPAPVQPAVPLSRREV